MVPNYYRNIVTGQNNYLDKVTSHKLSENEMEYRGSNSVFLKLLPKEISVKEQRVDGSYFIQKMKLRCTLMDYKNSYPFKYPSKQFNKVSFSTLDLQTKVNPWFITGFTDAEGCFSILIQSNTNYKTNWRVKAIFVILLHIKDIDLLESIKNTLGVGKIRIRNIKNKVEYVVESFKELQIIIEHFNNYPLVSCKHSDYLIFKQCYEIIKQDKHLTENGLEQIIALKKFLNLGVSDRLKKYFSNVIPINRPEFKFLGIPNPFWISGFVSGDGSFNLKIDKKATTSIGVSIRLRFSIGLHIRELDIIKGIAAYFNLLKPINFHNLDKENKYKNITILQDVVQLQITTFSDVNNIIIPFFDKYPILGKKSLDFLDFKTVSKLMLNRKHLTVEGLQQIIKIKEKMNLGRKW